MASGTGQDAHCAEDRSRIAGTGSVLQTIVAAFGTDLLDQWYSEVTKYGDSRLIYREYDSYHEAQEFGAVRGRAVLLIITAES